jgi:multicomponent Na+:H+ antiporter subunit D
VTALHPALPLLAAALLQGLARPRWRGPLGLAGALGALAVVATMPADASLPARLLGFELRLLAPDALARVFGLVFAAMAVLGTLYSLHVRRAGEQGATLVYAGAALGVVFAGDWLTLLLFWELMALSSTVVVWHGGHPAARAAGFRYLFVHLVSGMLVLGGVLWLHAGGTQAVGPVPEGAGFWLLLLGVALNAAVPPLHAWLTDAYPEASVTGAVFLSAFTTKTAVYVLLRAFPGTELLVWAGTAMALYGVVYAVLENDIRRLLAYHIVSQVGYMVAAVGMGTPLALDGAAAHAFCHILYKGLLFMGAGAVLAATGLRKLTELGGLAPRLKLVFALYMIGAFSISGVPLFNGFVSKSMVVSASAAAFPAVELLLTLASVGTFLHTGLKLPYFTFLGRRAGPPPAVAPLPANMVAAMALAAAMCIALGVFPGWLYARLPFGAAYVPYTVDHVVSSVQLLLGTAAAFVLLLPRLAGEPTISLDTDGLYRRPLPRLLGMAVAAANRAGGSAQAAGRRLVTALAALAADPGRTGSPYDPDERRLPVGLTIFWAVAAVGLLAALAQ